jgi:hypothetical protein
MRTEDRPYPVVTLGGTKDLAHVRLSPNGNVLLVTAGTVRFAISVADALILVDAIKEEVQSALLAEGGVAA